MNLKCTCVGLENLRSAIELIGLIWIVENQVVYEFTGLGRWCGVLLCVSIDFACMYRHVTTLLLFLSLYVAAGEGLWHFQPVQKRVMMISSRDQTYIGCCQYFDTSWAPQPSLLSTVTFMLDGEVSNTFMKDNY